MNNKNIEISSEEMLRQHECAALMKSENAGRGLKACVKTYGCQQNEADSERLAGMAAESGYELTDNGEEADLILINTCAVREHAELKALSITGQLKHLKSKRPSLIIGICGCMVTQEHRKEDIKHKYPYVDFLFGTSMLYRFPEILYNATHEDGRHFYLDDSDGNIAEGIPVHRENAFKALVSVMYGCNNFCTYCVVPYVRGRERSRHREDILAEIKQLADGGYREITLLGQNVNSYGRDLNEDYEFPDLLEDICRIEGDFIVRFMTSHPKDASRRLIDTIASNERIARQFHLPLQSGSNRVLELMNRHYTREDYLSLIEYMRSKIPDIAITTDIIVGFPTETEQDFYDTLDILQKVRFDNIYSFIYSKREGTPAASMEGQIPDEIKGERFARMLELQNEISRSKNEVLEGTTVRVLVEGISKADAAKLTGRTEKNRIVHFEGDTSLVGSFADVLITKAETHILFGEIK